MHRNPFDTLTEIKVSTTRLEHHSLFAIILATESPCHLQCLSAKFKLGYISDNLYS